MKLSRVTILILISWALPTQAVQKQVDNFDVLNPNQTIARNPNPAHGSVGLSTDVTLSWQGHPAASSYQIYWGTNHEAVLQANSSTNRGDRTRGRVLPIFEAITTTPQYQPELENEQDYYWRVDQMVQGQVYQGDVWSFNCADYLDYQIPAPEVIYYIERRNLSTTQFNMVASLQGLVARTRPEIFITHDFATTWFNDFSSYGIPKHHAGSISSLLARYRSHFNSYILCDRALDPPSVTAAFALAAVSPDSIVVDVTDLSLMQGRGDGIPMLADMRGKNDQWVWQRHANSFSKRALFLESHTGKGLRDLPITIGGLTWWNEDRYKTQAVLDAMLPNIPAHAFFNPTRTSELSSVRYHSENSIWNCVDEMQSNLTMFTAFSSLEPKIEMRQPVSDNKYPKKDKVHFVSFCMSDMDNINVMFDVRNWAHQKNRYGSPLRGQIPMGWGMPLALRQLGPTVMKWWLDNATENDGFIAYGSGLDYVYPSKFPHWNLHLHHVNHYLGESDIRALCILDYFHPQQLTYYNYKHIGEQYAALDNLDGFFMADVNGDYARNKGKILWFKNKPMITCRFTLWNSGQYRGVSQTPADLAASINRLPANPSSEYGYSFVIVHAWSYGLSQINECIQLLDKDVEVVTPYEMIQQVYHHNVNR